MAVDEGPSRMADIAARLNADANYASQYRLRLIAADMIHSAGHGQVEYTLPYMRDYLASTPQAQDFDHLAWADNMRMAPLGGSAQS